MTRLIQFSNNATSKLSANILASDTSLSVMPGDGAKFPALSGSKFFMATLIKADGTQEIIKVTGRSTDTFTITRAAEAIGSTQTSYAFSAGDRIELRMTAGALGTELDRLENASAAAVQNKSAAFSVVAADNGDLFRVSTASGTVAGTLPAIASLTDDFQVMIAKVTGDANQVAVTASGSDKINGQVTFALTGQYQTAWLIADRTNNVWTAINSGSGSSMVVDAFTGNGAANPLTLSGDPGSKNNTVFVIDGVAQMKSTYSISGTQLTPGGAIASGSKVEVWWAQPTAIGVPADGTVSTAKLAPVIAPVVSSINGGPLSGLRNKHIGGHFDTNPWQRGTSFTVTSSGTYVADRWRIDFDGTANISVAKVALPTAQVINGVFCRYGMKITVNSKSGGTYMRLSQRIEGVDTLTTLAATLQTAVLGSGSFSVPVQARQNFGTGGSPSADVVTPFAASLAVTASMQQLNTGLTVPDISAKTLGTGSNDFLATEYDLTNVPVGGYIVVALSGLEYGNQATVWEDRRRDEIGRCLRYFQRLPSTHALFSGSVTSGNVYYLQPAYLATMRATPVANNVTSNAQSSFSAPSAATPLATSVQFTATASATSPSAFYYAGCDLSAEL